ncbi:MAG: GyrI-like domain-containing protein [Clostridiaceae bacterium]
MFQIELKEKGVQPVLFVRTVTEISLLPTVVEETQKRISKYIKEAGGKAIDIPYSRYHKNDNIEVDVEIGIPIAAKLPGKGEIRSTVIPAGKYVVARYSGPFKTMDRAYGGILKWIYEEDLKPTSPYFGYFYESDETIPKFELTAKIIVPVE